MVTQVFIQKLRRKALPTVIALKGPPQSPIFILLLSQKPTELFEEFFEFLQVLLDDYRHLFVILEVLKPCLVEFEDVSTKI